MDQMFDNPFYLCLIYKSTHEGSPFSRKFICEYWPQYKDKNLQFSYKPLKICEGIQKSDRFSISTRIFF